jgi:elongation of very long chain fatty acids protein 6
VINHGFEHSMCNQRFCYGASGLWTLVFVLSKISELVDTLFIVLRKQKLIFLHYYHHATVLSLAFFTYSELTASGRWFQAMNYPIHAIMYSYYALKALKIRVPNFISKLVTSLQLLQMIIGCYINFYAYYLKKENGACALSYEHATASLIIYFSYFIMFAWFFMNSYIFPSKDIKIA